ncbi:hypothetical protein MKW94_013203 [Papaver nudicaule]|uniref:DNA-directed RNA polymerase n=1 Tax=Papaver nudicaule TaxID=74823 RepID=A0AA41S799_PAPNU|nr:hypothetical protein [Papaver nudicaule]
MWRNIAKRAISSKKSWEKISIIAIQVNNTHLDSIPFHQNPRLFNYASFSLSKMLNHHHKAKGYASVAKAMTDTEEDVEIQEELVEDKWQEEGSKMVSVTGNYKYRLLKKRQIKIETEAWTQATNEYKELLEEMCQQKMAPNLPYMKRLFLGWFEPFRDCIANEQELCKKKHKRANYAPYFDQLPADMMAVITMHKLMGLMMTSDYYGSARVVAAACIIGEAIENEVRIYNFLEKTRKKKPDQDKASEADPEAIKQAQLRKTVTRLMKKQKLRQVTHIVKGQDGLQPWGQDAQAKVGSRLIELLVQSAYIQPPVDQSEHGPPDIRPAFKHIVKVGKKDAQGASRKYGVIECDPLVRQGMERTAGHMVIPYMPMLVPPENWIRYDKGAYLFLPSYVMRTHGSRQQREAVKSTPRKQLEPVFEALDTLGNTKWRINKVILEVVDRIWAKGGKDAGLVERADVPLPEKPTTGDEAELKNWRQKLKDVKKENSERYSQRCDVELKLAVAHKMKVEDCFYYPHNLDFRGRAYPMHAYLNHLGSDLCRGILEFAEGRLLGNSGLLHLANLYATGGVDKLSYEGRIAFTESNLDNIFDSADRPFEGNQWWLKAEDPFQCLAVCMNLSEALRSSTPEATISHIPVHQDGSCNGLQHYTALGRDKSGAAAVNLFAGEKPADVYSGIAERVREIMQKDAQKDPVAYPNALHAKLLLEKGLVNRKLVKQTVMTSVYGVTYIGARDQINRRLKERDAGSDNREQFTLACYAAKVTLTALEEMFEAARRIMNWLSDCAKVIASENHPVQWITPLGLPVVQPYRKSRRHIINTSLQVLTLQRETDKVMIQRQRTAFPPNFVHSLDGSHMMMTALACKRAGMNFAGVHDSYWTHACDVDEMNRILREEFVELYEQPILENLLESFQKSFPTLEFPPLPERGDLNLKEVLESPFFFN